MEKVDKCLFCSAYWIALSKSTLPSWEGDRCWRWIGMLSFWLKHHTWNPVCAFEVPLGYGPPSPVSHVHFSGVRFGKSMFLKHFTTHGCKCCIIPCHRQTSFVLLSVFFLMFQALCCRPVLLGRCRESSVLLWAGDVSLWGCSAQVSVTQCFVQPCVCAKSQLAAAPAVMLGWFGSRIDSVKLQYGS